MKNITSEKNELNEKLMDLQSRFMRDNLLFTIYPSALLGKNGQVKNVKRRSGSFVNRH